MKQLILFTISHSKILHSHVCLEQCTGNGSCVKLFYCFSMGSRFTVLEPDLVLLFNNWIYVQGTQYIVEAMVHALSCLLF